MATKQQPKKKDTSTDEAMKIYEQMTTTGIVNTENRTDAQAKGGN